MTHHERMIKADSIHRRQRSGEITTEQASAEFDNLLDETGDLHFCGDTTLMKASWDGNDVMVFPKIAGSIDASNMSNTGIITQGPKRGEIVTHPEGQTANCDPDVLVHFMKLARKDPR